MSGRWSFSSGCDHCRWVFLGGLVPSEAEGKPPEMRTFLVPRGDYRIDDTWHVAGLKGTGSKDIVVEDAFVPEHRTHRLIDGYKRKSPGNAVNTAPLYRLPFGQVFVRSVSTSAIGIAQGALDAYRAVAAKRVAACDGAKVAEDVSTQFACASAASVIDEVRLVLYRNMDELMARARSGEEHAARAPRRLPLRLGQRGGEVRRRRRRSLLPQRRARHVPRTARSSASSSTPTRRVATTPTTPTSPGATSAACSSGSRTRTSSSRRPLEGEPA